MRDEQMYNIGDEVRVKFIGYDNNVTYAFGKVLDVKSEDISYHGSPYYQYTYKVELYGGSTRWYGYMEDPSRPRAKVGISYICPVPTKEQVVERINREMMEISAQIEKLQAEFEQKKAFKFDVLYDNIKLEEID